MLKEEKKFVLDHGHVILVDHMGDDDRVVVAARQSTTGATKTPAEDAFLINYLMANEHHTPFEMVVFTFDVKLPIFVARQWIRHRIGSFNEFSGRYSVLPDECYVPEQERIRGQDKYNLQGSGLALDDFVREEVREIMLEDQRHAFGSYNLILQKGVSKEVSRINLPLSSYTKWYWTVNFRSLMNFLKLRLDSHAQWEIQEYARAIQQLVKPLIPVSYQAFEEHVLYAKKLSRSEWRTTLLSSVSLKKV